MPDVVPTPARPSAHDRGVAGPESERPIGPTGRLVGLDLGARRIGVAVSDSERRLAMGVTAVVRRDPDLDARRIAELVVEYDAVGLVVGMPLSLSGEQGPAARNAAVEIDRLRRTSAVPLDTVDERLTTVQASGALRSGGRSARRQRAVIDQEAAARLLQTWLDRHRETH